MLTEKYITPVKSKRPIRPWTIKDYTTTRGLSDHGLSKIMQKQEDYQIKDHQTIQRHEAYQITDH